jgi:hypothetical protein
MFVFQEAMKRKVTNNTFYCKYSLSLTTQRLIRLFRLLEGQITFFQMSILSTCDTDEKHCLHEMLCTILKQTQPLGESKKE